MFATFSATAEPKEEKYGPQILAYRLDRCFPDDRSRWHSDTRPNQNHHRRRRDEPAHDPAAHRAGAGSLRQARHRSAHRAHQGRAHPGRQSHLRRSRSRLHRRHVGARRGGARAIPKNSLVYLQQAHSYDARQSEFQDRRAIARQTLRHPEHGRHHLDAHDPRASNMSVSTSNGTISTY